MLIYDVRFPISDGLIVAALRTALTPDWVGLAVSPKLPDTKARRMVTVRNDSGPSLGRVSRRRYGVNVWADSSVDAENLALDAMSVCGRLADGLLVCSVDSFTGPFEVDDDPQMTVGAKNLTHFYFAFRASVKGNESV